LVSRLAAVETEAEDGALSLMTSGVVRFGTRHPLIYAALAFIIGGGIVSLFTMSTYAWWVHYPIDVVTPLYQTVIGGVAGGIAMVIVAFAYRRSLASLGARY
jgi:hypothetical protein